MTSLELEKYVVANFITGSPFYTNEETENQKFKLLVLVQGHLAREWTKAHGFHLLLSLFSSIWFYEQSTWSLFFY